MVEDKQDRNPLLKPLGPYRSIPEWPALLEHNPLDGLPIDASEEVLDEYLGYADERFAATRAALNVAMEIQTMLRAGYRQRNPYIASNRKLFYRLLSRKPEKVKGLPPFYYPRSYCLIIRGITNLGKSSAVTRVLKQFDQVVVHGKDNNARWLQHVQVVHLTVKMSPDGTRKGLLLNILGALDTVLFTDYFNEFSRGQQPIEKLSIEVQRLLATHSVGMLVIEEMQAKNFMRSRYASDLQLFFLSILSFGIPIVLIGNPMAFVDVGEFKQTESRFLSIDPITIWPYHDWQDSEWCKAVAPAIWGYQVVSEAEPYSDDVAEAVWRRSGGIPGYARKLVADVQKNVIRGVYRRLDVETIKRHYEKSESFAEFRPLIEALCTCDNKRLVSAKGDDIPKDAFVRHWKSLGLDRKQGDEKAESSNGQGADESIAVETGDWTDKKKKVTSSIKSRKTKRKRKTERNARVQATTSNDDLRHSDTVQQRLAKGLDQLEDELQEKKQTKKSERRKK